MISWRILRAFDIICICWWAYLGIGVQVDLAHTHLYHDCVCVLLCVLWGEIEVFQDVSYTMSWNKNVTVKLISKRSFCTVVWAACCDWWSLKGQVRMRCTWIPCPIVCCLYHDTWNCGNGIPIDGSKPHVCCLASVLSVKTFFLGKFLICMFGPNPIRVVFEFKHNIVIVSHPIVMFGKPKFLWHCWASTGIQLFFKSLNHTEGMIGHSTTSPCIRSGSSVWCLSGFCAKHPCHKKRESRGEKVKKGKLHQGKMRT